MNVIIMGIDGFLGWPLAMHLANKGYNVSGADNFTRRRCVEEIGSQSATPILTMGGRTNTFYDKYHESIEFYYGDLTETRFTDWVVEKSEPDVIVHFGEIPSAPYSMIDGEHCNYVQTNNIVGTNNILHAMKDRAPRCHLVKLGTMGEYGCYDDQTEIFTETGWKHFYDLDKKDLVATRTKEDRTIQFVKPNSIHAYDFTDKKMYFVKGQRIDLVVTPNHRMFTMSRSSSKLRLENIWEIEGERRIYDVGLIWEGQEKTHYPFSHQGIQKEIPMDLWLRFLGWFLTEGCVPKRRDRPNSYRTEIRQNTIDMVKIVPIVDELTTLLNLDYSVYDEPNGASKITIWGKFFASYFSRYGKSHEKYIDTEIKELSKRQLKILLDVMLEGDGWIHRAHRNNYRYFSVSKQLADDVQEIALKCGYSANISQSKGGYTVNLCSTTKVHINNGTKKNDGWTSYKGKVYCVNVGGDGIIFVRRNGKPVWCGNTPNKEIPEAEVSMFPRAPGSYYHASKVADSVNVEFACKVWGLQSTDIMQGIVHGLHVPGIIFDELLTRFDFDECFGTAINRFCAQSVIDHPITPYGWGGQTRGYLALQDSLQCLTLAIENPPSDGEYRVFNQFDECYSVNELAERVQKVAQEYGSESEIVNVENPRVEAEEHFYKPKSERLRRLGFKPTQPLEKELHTTIAKLMQFKDRIEAKREHIMPKTMWR